MGSQNSSNSSNWHLETSPNFHYSIILSIQEKSISIKNQVDNIQGIFKDKLKDVVEWK